MIALSRMLLRAMVNVTIGQCKMRSPRMYIYPASLFQILLLRYSCMYEEIEHICTPCFSPANSGQNYGNFFFSPCHTPEHIFGTNQPANKNQSGYTE